MKLAILPKEFQMCFQKSLIGSALGRKIDAKFTS